MGKELDIMLAVLSSPVRRRIINRLSKESSYPLKLAGDLGVHQQLITKHLRVMEEAKVVEAKKESSPYGPDRRMYSLTKSMSIIINFSPDFYSTSLLPFEDISLTSKYETLSNFRERVNHFSNNHRSFERVDQFMKLITDIDKKMNELDGEKITLLYLRSRIIRVVKKEIQRRKFSFRDKTTMRHILNKKVMN